MIKTKIKIWQVFFILLILLMVVRANLILNTCLLFLKWIKILFVDFNFGSAQLNLSFIDSIIAPVLLSVCLITVIIYRNRINPLSKKIDFTSATVIILLIFFLFAPLVSNSNPDFQKNLIVTKLLPPLSRVKVLHLKPVENNNTVKHSDYLRLKKEVIKASFDDEIIFVDSISVKDEIEYYQSGLKKKINKNILLYKDGAPYITSKMFLLGTDELGRDIFTRLVYGTRISLFVGLGSVVVALILGLLTGFLSGYFGKTIDLILSRVTDMFLAFPVIFFIILILALFGNTLFTVIFVLGFSGWMSLFKIVRTEVISIKQKDFFITSKQLGIPLKNLLLKEVFPLIIAPVVVNIVFLYGNVILAEAALSFLGLGTGNNYPSWGTMIEQGQNYLTSAWWMIFSPALFLFATVFSANNLGKKINILFNN